MCMCMCVCVCVYESVCVCVCVKGREGEREGRGTQCSFLSICTDSSSKTNLNSMAHKSYHITLLHLSNITHPKMDTQTTKLYRGQNHENEKLYCVLLIAEAQQIGLIQHFPCFIKNLWMIDILSLQIQCQSLPVFIRKALE